jgi:putative PIN family toxin of toxin-antitoxin system
MKDLVVIDTNVLIAALIKADAAPPQLFRLCMQQRVVPLMGTTLLKEYEEVMQRETLFVRSPLSGEEREGFLDAYLSVCEWISVYYLWRPNLRDEADNHLIELAIPGGAKFLVTGNTKDFRGASLHFPSLAVVTPRMYLTQRGR